MRVSGLITVKPLSGLASGREHMLPAYKSVAELMYPRSLPFNFSITIRYRLCKCPCSVLSVKSLNRLVPGCG